MKINKKLVEKKLKENEAEETVTTPAGEEAEAKQASEVTTDDVIIDDVGKASVSEIADAIQDTAVAAEAPPVSDKTAEDMAKEIKTYAKGINAAAWAPLDYENALTKKLDACLAASLTAKKNKTKNRANILITGLPGSGKTAIVEQWASARGIVLCPVMAGEKDLDATLNGFAVDDVTKNDDNTNNHKIIRSHSTALDPLEKPRSVLFLDEFNRADYGTRSLLLTLINSHKVIDREFPEMLFTIACINPAVDSDPGATELLDAEKSRFIQHYQWDSTPERALKYLRGYLKEILDATDPNDEDYALLYRTNAYKLNLAIKLLSDRRFRFDDENDLQLLADNSENMLNQRLITDLIMAFGYDKDVFLDCIDSSGILEKNKKIIHEILDTWIPPQINDPSGAPSTATTPDQTAQSTEQQSSGDGLTGDFASVFGNNGSETDTGLFGTGATAEQKAVRVDAQAALAKIQAFSF